MKNKLLDLQLEHSERRQKIGELLALGEEMTDEQRQDLEKHTSRMPRLEVELRAAIVAEPQGQETRVDATGSEARELQTLVDRSNVGAIFQAAIEHRQSDGPEAELQKHYGMGANQVPLALLRGVPLEVRGEVEHRAVTPAPANVATQQAAIIPGVFPMACAAWLGVDMPTVGVGEAVYPVLTMNATVGTPAENDVQADTTGSFSADVLSPGRLQAAFFYSREDAARFMGMGEALRQNLNEALSDKLDQQILNGTNGLFNGTNLANHNVSAVTTYALYRDHLAYGRVDGTWANMVSDIKVLMGSSTYAHCAKGFRSDNAGDRAALEDLMNVTGGVKVSAHVPAASGNPAKQNAVIRLGMRRDMVAPVWDGVTLIPDEVTKAANGQIVITAVMLYAVKILRTGGFYKQQTQHA